MYIELFHGWLSSSSSIYDKENGQLEIFLLEIFHKLDLKHDSKFNLLAGGFWSRKSMKGGVFD